MSISESQEPVYSVDQGELIVACREGIIWRGRPLGKLVDDAFRLIGTKDSLVLLNWDKSGEMKFRNVLRCRPDGSVVWKAELPSDPEDSSDDELFDTYVSIWVDDECVGATSWSGYRVCIDIDSGRITRQEFVK